MSRGRWATVALGLLVVAGASTLAVALPVYPDHRIPYAGQLDEDGVPVHGTLPMTFRLFDAAVDGTELWSEVRTGADAVEVHGGRFSVELGAVAALPRAVLEAPALYLDVEVDGVWLGRQRIHAATQSVRAAEGAGTVGIGSIIAHTTHLPGSYSVAEMQSQGFAVLDGSTAAAQGIAGAVITGALPNLNGGGHFLRGGATSGALQDDATARNGLGVSDPGHDHVTIASDNCGNFNGDFGVGGFLFRNVALSGSKRLQAWDTVQNCNSGHYTTGGSGTGLSLNAGDGETRPLNMSVIWMMRVR